MKEIKSKHGIFLKVKMSQLLTSLTLNAIVSNPQFQYLLYLCILETLTLNAFLHGNFHFLSLMKWTVNM